MVLENLNKNQDQEISIEELADAVKDGGFLDKDENIKKVVDHIQENPDELTNTLKENLTKQIEKILQQEGYNESDLKIINLRNKLLSQENTETKRALISKLDTMIQSISTDVNKNIGKNIQGNANYYNKDQVMAIQLHANIKYGQSIKLDGQRIGNNQESWILFNLAAQTPNQQLTNLYIYKQELATRWQVIDIRKAEKNLLNIPNIDNLLQTVADIEIQKEIFNEFLDFFLKIRGAGISFENKIQGKNLESLLINMINKEKYKDIKMDKKFFVETNDPKEKIYIEESMTKYETMWDYCNSQVQAIKTNISKTHWINIQNNNIIIQIKQQEKLLEDIKGIEQQINTLMDPIQKIEEQKKLLSKSLEEKTITLVQYNTSIEKLNQEEAIAGQNMFNEKNYRKDEVLRYQIIEKKLDIYKIHPDENMLTLICLELKQHFNDKQIQWFLTQDNINNSLDYTKYQSIIKKNQEQWEELHTRDSINDILGQYNSQSIVISSITGEEYEKNFPLEYTINDVHIIPSDRLWTQKTSIPKNLYKIQLTPNSVPIYVKNSNREDVPPKRENKKIIIMPNSIENRTIFGWNTALSGTNNITFAYASKDKSWNIIIEDIHGKQVKTIPTQDQEKAQNTMHKANLDIYDYDMQNTLKSFEQANTALDPLNKALEKYQSGWFFATLLQKEWENKGIDDTQAKDAIAQLKVFSSKVWYLETQVGSWKEQKEKLLEIKKQSSGIQNEFEQGIDNMIATFDQMILFFEVKNETSQARELTNEIAKMSSNNNPREAFKDFLQKDSIKIIIAIAGAVAAICLAKFTAGGSLVLRSQFVGSLRWVSMIWAIWGMVWLRGGMILNEYVNNKFNPQYSDGSLRFSDPTDIERWKKGQLSTKDLLIGLWKEFAIGTITTMTFIKAGQIIGNAIAKSGSPGLIRFQQGVNKFMGNGDTAANHNAINGFWKEFSKEFGQEMRQESLESVGEWVHPVLWWLMSVMSCLSWPWYANISTKLKIGWGNTVFDYNNQTVKQVFTYDHKQKNIQELQQYRETQGLTTRQEHGKIIAEQKLEKPIVTKNWQKITTQIYEYIPSTASVETNNMIDILNQYNMKINHNVTDQNWNPINEASFPHNIDPDILEKFQMQIALGGKWTIANHPDGSFTLNTTTESIIFKASTEISTETITNLNATVDRLTIQTQVDQNYNEKKIALQAQINTETDTDIKKSLIKKLNSLETAYNQINKVLNGESTMKDYVGIRTYAKELWLKNIETNMLPLTRKIIENHLQKINPGKEITQSDINTYINSEINIDEVIREVFGENLWKEQEFKGSDAKTQIMEILQSFPTKSSDLLSAKNVETLETYALWHIATLEAGLNLNQQQIFDIVQKNIRKAIFQNIADKWLLSWSDHGIVHIIEWNVFAARKIIDQIQELDPKISAKLKAMVGQIIIDHDIWYNMQTFEQMIKEMDLAGNYDKKMFFEATKDHPLFSRLFLEANADHYIEIFGKENFDIMKVAMLDHSDVHSTGFSNDIYWLNQWDPQAIGSTLQKLISLADCMGVTHVDKLHALFKYPNMLHLLWKFEFIQKNIPSNSTEWARLNKEIKQQMYDEIKKMEQAWIIDKNTAEQYHNAIEKGMDISDDKWNNPNWFWLKFNFSSFIYSPEGYTLENNNKWNMKVWLDLDMFKVIHELYGSEVAINNLKKLVGDYGAIKTITIGETTIKIVDENNIKIWDQIIKTKKGKNTQDAMIESLAEQIKQAASPGSINIQTTAKDGSLINFTIKLNPRVEANSVIYENLLLTANKNDRLNKPINEIYQELGKKVVDQKTIQDNIIKIKELYPEIADAIKDIVENKAIIDKKTAINKILAENISTIYDQNTSIQGIETNNNTDMQPLTESETLAISDEINKEYQEITQEIESNKNNPSKIKEIMIKINKKVQDIQWSFTKLVNSDKPIIIKTKEYLKLMHHIHLVHHVTSSIKTIVNDWKNSRNNTMEKQRYSLIWNTTNVTTQLLLDIAVIWPHIIEALHILTWQPSMWWIAALSWSTTSLKIVSDNIELIAKTFKESMIVVQEKVNIKKQLELLLTAELTKENRLAMIENYKNMTKWLASGMNIEKNGSILEEFYKMGYTLTIDTNSSMQDIFDHIIQERENDSWDYMQHRDNIHQLVNMIKPQKELRNMAKNIQYNMIGNKYDAENLTNRENILWGSQREHALHIGH